jgi:hypothetical protein
MRFGRILLAVLAPLFSVSPALKADVTPESHAPAVDSLLNLLRSVVPSAVSTADPGSHATAQAPYVAGPASRPFLEPHLTPQPSPAAEANLHLLERQHLRTLLRC